MLNTYSIAKTDIKFSFFRSPGPGGQNVNKVATGVLLRFNVHSLPEEIKTRLIAIAGKKINQQNELMIKAMRYRTQERNKQDALVRLNQLIKRASVKPKKRIKTKPSLAAKQKRLVAKKIRGRKKSLRSNKGLELG